MITRLLLTFCCPKKVTPTPERRNPKYSTAQSGKIETRRGRKWEIGTLNFSNTKKAVLWLSHIHVRRYFFVALGRQISKCGLARAAGSPVAVQRLPDTNRSSPNRCFFGRGVSSGAGTWHVIVVNAGDRPCCQSLFDRHRPWSFTVFSRSCLLFCPRAVSLSRAQPSLTRDFWMQRVFYEPRRVFVRFCDTTRRVCPQTFFSVRS